MSSQHDEFAEKGPAGHPPHAEPPTPFVPDAPPGTAGDGTLVEDEVALDETRQFSVVALMVVVAILAGWLAILQTMPEKVGALVAGMGTLVCLGAMALGKMESLAARMVFWGLILVYVAEIAVVMWRQAHPGG